MTESVWIVSFHQIQHGKNYFGNIKAKSRTDVSRNYHNQKNQQKQEKNVEVDTPVESERQLSVLSITTCPVIILPPE